MAEDELQTEGAPAPATWDHNAAFWDSVVGDAGNAFHRLLVAPATLELLRLQAGEMVLDVAGGNARAGRALPCAGVAVVRRSRKERRMAEPGITQSEIEAGLHALGLPAGAAVEVHCSLSAFGWVHGGASAVIAALKHVVGSAGTLVMSAYPVSPPVPLSAEDVARGISWKVRRLAEDAPDRTGMGVVADTFRRQPDVRCGTGLFRTCAWGKHADQHCAGYDALLEQDGWTLLLGVGIERCSSMHAAERSPLPEAIAVYERVPDAVRRHYDPECWSVGWGGMPDDAWAKVFAAADRQGLIRHAWIGRAQCHLFRTRAVVASYADWRRADPWDLYGVLRPADLSD